ncbi:ParA family protein [Leifsonia sp. TF02-11]|uniref:ParA family protein n=1 Tax=Leifsonia sp. TF02-11 TaxID=2815212 RepID=UPI001AA1BE2F|nr:AAA family ATPase [Leifsonia sp. TF02-11]MBO1740748.1 AAA family ATPase [Leifsonia sp. TF02-11]
MNGSKAPQAFAEITGGNATFQSPGAAKSDTLIVPLGDDARAFVLRRAVWEARRLGEPIQLTTAGDHGEHRILVSPDGTIAPGGTGQDIDAFVEAVPEAAEGPGTASHSTRPTSRPSFVDAEPAPRRTGIPAALARLGIPVRPSNAQAQHDENVRATSRHWGGCRVVAVVNGKGGVGKTMTSAMLAAVFARNGGGGVLAWDNNDTRGTLGWRTEASHHDATVQDALAAAPRLLDTAAGAGDIAWYVHHQTQDRYDVLRSNPQLLAASQRIGQAEFDQLLQVAARYYRLVIFDSGNDESATRWLRMVDSAQQLVVPTLAAPESAESAALLLEALAGRDEHSAELAKGAVVVLTQAERGTNAEVQRIADAFAPLVRAVQVIPFDPALKSGPLRFDALRPATQRAWVAAGAAIAAGLQS